MGSPECAIGRRYNLKADVYSYALLTHQVLTLEKPYDDISDEDHDDFVFHDGVRPHIPLGLPVTAQQLLRRAWSPKISERPTMETVRQVMAEQRNEILRYGSLERRSPSVPVAHTTGYVWSCSFASISDNNKMLKKWKKNTKNIGKSDADNKAKGYFSIFRKNKKDAPNKNG